MKAKFFNRLIGLLCTLTLVSTLIIPTYVRVEASPNLTFVGQQNEYQIKLLELNGSEIQTPFITRNFFESITFELEDLNNNSPSFDTITYYSNNTASLALTVDQPSPGVNTMEDVYFQKIAQGSATDSLTIQIIDSNNPTTPVDTITIPILAPSSNNGTNVALFYYNNDEPGALLRKPFTSAITGFSNNLQITFPQNTFIKNETNNNIFKEQLLDMTVESYSDTPEVIFLSRAFAIEPINANNDFLAPSSPGKITLNYKKDINREVALYHLTISKLEGGEWIPIGGKVNSKKFEISAPIVDFGTYAVTLSYKTYNDLSNWAKPFVMALTYKGVIVPDNLDDGRLKENINHKINRYDFTVMLSKGLNLPPVPYQDLFYDIQADTGVMQESGLLIEGKASANGSVKVRFYDDLNVRNVEFDVTVAKDDLSSDIAKKIADKVNTSDPLFDTLKSNYTVFNRSSYVVFKAKDKGNRYVQLSLTDTNNIGITGTYELLTGGSRGTEYRATNGANYIMAAVSNGIVQGKTAHASGQNKFGPKDNLTRAEAAVMAARAMKLKVDTYSDLDKTKKSLLKHYKKEDIENTPGWALPYVLAVTNAKIMQGNTSKEFLANQNLSFEEASALIYKLMDKLKLFGN